MATLSVLKSNAGPILAGVYGQRCDDGSFEIDRDLRRIYLFSLNPTLPSDCDTFDIEVPDHLLPALKANLLDIAQRRWAAMYERNAPLAGVLEQALRAEQRMVAQHCADIVRELGFGDYKPYHVDFVCNFSIDCGDSDFDEAQETEAAALFLLEGNAMEARLSEAETPLEAYPQEVMLSSGSYAGVIRMELSLAGSKEHLSELIPLVMPQIANSGLLNCHHSDGALPTAVLVSCQRVEDVLDQDDTPAEQPRG